MADNSILKNNLVSFRQKFRDFTDNYTVIGGTACMILMDEAGRNFRATKDVDMILIMEDGGKDFGQVFWDYIIEGQYTCGWKGSEPHYYRFTDPIHGYPGQIELFSKRSDFIVDSRIIPIHIEDDISSLSAIALDKDFYDFMKGGRRIVDGISILGAEFIIPFKMYAWLNNIEKRQRGEHVNEDDIKKHKNDVFRLLPLTNPDVKVPTRGNVKNAVKSFLEAMKDEPIAKEFLSGGRTKTESLEIIKKLYLEN
ncbi:MAG: hypothetical protein IJ757_05270 [Clostridiales bacterium]|nr:hypothetical protein [Clostridiales bacterium]